VGDLITTPSGPKRITHLFYRDEERVVKVSRDNGLDLICTPDHPFYTQHGLVPAKALVYDSSLFTFGDTSWHNQYESIQLERQNTRSMSSNDGDIIGSRLWGILDRVRQTLIYTEMSMSPITAPSQPACASTIKTITQRIITQTTSVLSLIPHMAGCIRTSLNDLLRAKKRYAPPLSLLRSGGVATQMRQKLSALLGLQASSERLPQSRRSSASARIAAPSFFDQKGLRPLCAPENVSLQKDGVTEWMMSPAHAVAAGQRSCVINTAHNSSVTALVVEELGEKRTVYNIEVEDAHCYFANDVLVSNCEALGYGTIHFYNPNKGEPRATSGRRRPDTYRPASSAGY
jgi:hypothetical protein